MSQSKWRRAIRDFLLTVLLSALVAGCLFAADYAPQTLWIRPHEPSYQPTTSHKFISGFMTGGGVGVLLGLFIALSRLTDPPNSTD